LIRRRVARLLTALVCQITGFIAVAAVTSPAALAGPDPTVRWCSVVSAPCVVSAAHDGTPFTSSDTTYRVNWPWYGQVGGVDTPDDHFFQVMKDSGTGFGIDLGSDEIGHVFTITLDFGSMVPRVVWGWADPASNPVVRAQQLDGSWQVTLRLMPVRRLQSCIDLGTLTCPFTAAPDDEIQAQLYGDVNDASWWGTTEADRDQLMGLNSFTNVDVTDEQPDIQIDPTTGTASMTIRMANAHEDAGHNAFLGFQKIRLPNRMLRDVYGIPAPETMTPDSLASAVSGGVGTIHTYQEAGDDAMHVDVSNVTFSIHRLKVRRGTITPTRPKNVTGTRTGEHRARLAFDASSPRGARVTGYAVHCATSGSTADASGKSSPIVVTGLKKGTAYTCYVRAKSKAGSSRRSAGAQIARRPS
jgi:Fibronectin type III domain